MFRLFNRYILTNMTPSESYDMTLTWKGQGVNYQTRVKTFEVQMYPSEVTITQVDAFAHKIELSFETTGNFSVRNSTHLKYGPVRGVDAKNCLRM